MIKEPTPTVEHAGRTFEAHMAEISGFGGDYEAACRTMMLEGLAYLEQHPKALLREVADHIARFVEHPTGAMVWASASHAMYAAKLGWTKYVEDSRAQARRDERGGAA